MPGADLIRVESRKDRTEFVFSTKGQDWLVSGRFVLRDKALVLDQLAIQAARGNDDGLTARRLSDIPLSAFREAVHRHQLELELKDLTTGAATGGGADGAPRRGRPPRSSERSRKLALDYLELQNAGASFVMEKLARKYDIPVSTMRGRIRQVTEAGWLTPAIPGKPGRLPGPRLLADPGSTEDSGVPKVRKIRKKMSK